MRLGFTVPPRGSHVEWGTGSWCIMFPEDYLELRRIIDTDRPLQGLDAAAPEILPPRPYFGAITLRVTDLARMGATLEGHAVEFTWADPGRRLRVPASQACGTVLDFVDS